MNIILIGFMGSGKSVVGKLLAERLGLAYLDADEEIAGKEGLGINDIFAKKGEPYFRDLETGFLREMKGRGGIVLSTGGGMVLREENVKMLKEMGPLVLLWAEPRVIFERVRNSWHRPLLNVADPMAEIEKILGERKPVYEKVADLKVDTSRLGVNEIGEKIITWLRSR